MCLCSQNPATLTYSVAVKSAKHYDMSFLIMSSQLWSSNDTHASRLQTRTSYTFIISVVNIYAPCNNYPHCFDHPNIPWRESQAGTVFCVAYALTLKKELSFECFVCKVRAEVEETVEL